MTWDEFAKENDCGAPERKPMMTETNVRDLRKRLIEAARTDQKNGFTDNLPQAIAAANALSIVLGDQPTAQTEVFQSDEAG